MTETAGDKNEQKFQPKITPKTDPKFIKVKDLSPSTVGFNVVVRVGKIKPIMNRLNLDGTKLRISEALIGDTTGCVILSLRNDQIAMVNEGDVLILRNAKIDMVNNGFMRVAIDRWGLIIRQKSDQLKDEILLKNNLSEVEYELVKERDLQNDNRNYNNNFGGRNRNRRNYGGFRGGSSRGFRGNRGGRRF